MPLRFFVVFGLAGTCPASWADAGLNDPIYDRVIDTVVASRPFKVEIAGIDVRVTDRSRIVRETLAERDAMREAVHQATGCALVDELYPMDGRLRGRLKFVSR